MSAVELTVTGTREDFDIVLALAFSLAKAPPKNKEQLAACRRIADEVETAKESYWKSK